jgi:hypothetical protein
MSLYAIADLHLPFGENKPMSIFKGWENHTERLRENWNSAVGEQDTVVIAGDISWAAGIEAALPDFAFIDALHGRKIIIKGNHDYWWTSLSKMNAFLKSNNMNSIEFLYNNAFLVGNIAVCGTRGWLSEQLEASDKKLQKREAGRLEASVKAALALSEDSGITAEICAFLHYPPIYGGSEDYEIIDVLQGHGVKRCFYGHLHGASHKNALLGTRYGIEFSLISADFIGFKPLKVC